MKRSKNRLGQSTVEFALSLLVIMGVVIFTFQLAMTFAVGNLFHYGTFMAARALLSAGSDPDEQLSRARQVLARTVKRSEFQEGVDRFSTLAKGDGGSDAVMKGASLGAGPQFDRQTATLSWMEGVRYSFRSRLSLIPLQRGAEANSVSLTSESWLGREPTSSECLQEMAAQGGRIDNGC